jgi:hypothetical protein
MIGDSFTNVAAGKSAGCRTALPVECSANIDCAPDLVTQSPLEATEKILELDESSAIEGRR